MSSPFYGDHAFAEFVVGQVKTAVVNALLGLVDPRGVSAAQAIAVVTPVLASFQPSVSEWQARESELQPGVLLIDLVMAGRVNVRLEVHLPGSRLVPGPHSAPWDLGPFEDPPEACDGQA